MTYCYMRMPGYYRALTEGTAHIRAALERKNDG
jgi:hypothetical protein